MQKAKDVTRWEVCKKLRMLLDGGCVEELGKYIDSVVGGPEIYINSKLVAVMQLGMLSSLVHSVYSIKAE